MTGTPWSRVDAVRTAVFVAVGSVLWVIGWYRVAEEPGLSAQVAPLNLAIAGIVIVGGGQIAWFLGGRRAVHHRRRALLGAGAVPVLRVERRDGEPDAFVGSERFYHRSDCAMVADRVWAPRPRAEHESAGRAPCGVCAP